MMDEAKNAAREEGERIKEAARGEMEQEVNRAKETLEPRSPHLRYPVQNAFSANRWIPISIAACSKSWHRTFRKCVDG